MIRSLLLASMLVLSSTASMAERPVRELPPFLQTCFEQALKNLVLTKRSDRNKLKQLFLDNIDADRLGKRSFGPRAWQNAKPKWRSAALEYYFDMINSKGETLTEGMKDANNTIVTPRLADHPERGVDEQVTWHVAATVMIDNGNSFSVAVLTTSDCKAYDFSQGGWVSGFMDANIIDRLVKK